MAHIKTGYEYLRNVPLQKRKEDCDKIKQKYPNRIPVIVLQNTSRDTSLPVADKFKFIVPFDLTVGQFQYVLRNRMKISPDKAVFLFADKTQVLHASVQMDLVYTEHASTDDGFLYLTIAGENTFG